MGTVYAYRGKLRIMFVNAHGQRKNVATPFIVGQEKEAAAALLEVERSVERQRRVSLDGKSPPTLSDFTIKWNEKRAKTKAGAKMDAGRLHDHVLPVLGNHMLSELRPFHVRDMVEGLVAKGLAPKTVHNVYGVLHRMLEDAVEDEVITVSPCSLKRGTLPKKKDKVPGWRNTAVFNRDEAERLISDEGISQQRRVQASLMFLAGLRYGEVAALRWSDWDPTLRPLGRLSVTRSFESHGRTEKGTKTDCPRNVPVHPVLAAMLAEWKLATGGGGDGLVAPHPNTSRNQLNNYAYDRWQADLRRMGIRRRRQHDARRTFVSLALADGASREMLHWVSHGSKRDILDAYTTPPWEALCAAVSNLKIARRAEAQVLKLLAVGDTGPSAHRMHTIKNSASDGLQTMPGAGLEGAPLCSSRTQPDPVTSEDGSIEAHSGAGCQNPVCISAHKAKDAMGRAVSAAAEWGPSKPAVAEALSAALAAVQIRRKC